MNILSNINKLNVNALKLDFKVLRFGCQKLIKKKEARPISSHPKNKVKKLFASTKQLIPPINIFNQKIKKNSFPSFLK